MVAERSLKGAEAIFLALLTIGLIGLLFLIIFGNLSNNLGWTQTSTSFSAETINLSGFSGSTPAGASGRVNGLISSVTMINATNATHSIPSTNFTISGVLINASDTSVDVYNQLVNVSYTVAFDSTSKLNTEDVISNLTGGATQFFTFSNVWFILTAITILIAIVLGVIVLVKKSSSGGMGGKGNKSRSEFAT